MEQELIEQLESRNSKIIEAVIEKSKTVCPDSIALIGITGSFCTGDFHEKSDLDLCIIINDENGWKVASCFILDKVAHDIYCTPWKKLDAMAEYTDPYIVKLLDLDIVYCAHDQHLERYLEMRGPYAMHNDRTPAMPTTLFNPPATPRTLARDALSWAGPNIRYRDGSGSSRENPDDNLRRGRTLRGVRLR